MRTQKRSAVRLLEALAACAMAGSLLAGCAGADTAGAKPTDASSPSPQSTWPSGCTLDDDARHLRITDGGFTIDVAVLGNPGATAAVVMSNQSLSNLCSWLPLAERVADAGFAVALYNYAGAPTDDIERVSARMRADGARHLALVGASQGAKATIIAAASATKPPDAVVSLSAEEMLGTTPVIRSAKRLHVPTLYVTAADDPLGATAATREFAAKAPATIKPLVVLPGQEHGVDMLDDKLITRVVGFLDTYGR